MPTSVCSTCLIKFPSLLSESVLQQRDGKTTSRIHTQWREVIKLTPCSKHNCGNIEIQIHGLLFNITQLIHNQCHCLKHVENASSVTFLFWSISELLSSYFITLFYIVSLLSNRFPILFTKFSSDVFLYSSLWETFRHTAKLKGFKAKLDSTITFYVLALMHR